MARQPCWLSWWPVGLGQSWLLAGVEHSSPVRLGGLVWEGAGLALAAAGFSLGGGFPRESWRLPALTGSALSLGLLLVYLHPFYRIGLASSAALRIVVVRPIASWP